MKSRMEKQIAATFVVIFVMVFIINIMYNRSCSVGILVDSLTTSLLYVLCVNMFSTKHKLLLAIEVVAIVLLISLLYGQLSLIDAADSLNFWSGPVLTLYSMVVAIIAINQAKRLRKEESQEGKDD